MIVRIIIGVVADSLVGLPSGGTLKMRLESLAKVGATTVVQ